MSTTSNRVLTEQSAAAAGRIPEFGIVRMRHAVRAEGYQIPPNTRGTVVAIYGDGAAYAVEIADLPGGPEVVTLRADQIERIF